MSGNQKHVRSCGDVRARSLRQQAGRLWQADSAHSVGRSKHGTSSAPCGRSAVAVSGCLGASLADLNEEKLRGLGLGFISFCCTSTFHTASQGGCTCNSV